MKIDWKAKLSSRKFWALIAALAVSVLQGVLSPEVVVQITGIIMAVGACAVYVMAEAKVDASYNAANTTNTESCEEDEEDA